MVKNRIVLFANQKGGAGKSTLCTLLAHDMTQRQMPVVVADADLQQSLYQLRDQEVKSTGISKDDAPWDLMWIDCRDIKSVKAAVDMLKKVPATVLIDVPGNLSDDNLAPLYLAADLVVCPMTYQIFTINSTKRFADVIVKINPRARLVFLPNNISSRKSADDARTERSCGYELQHNFRGSWLAKEIGRYKCLERISTLTYSKEQADKVAPGFEGIYKWL
jgi:chromosome partitioning protein